MTIVLPDSYQHRHRPARERRPRGVLAVAEPGASQVIAQDRRLEFPQCRRRFQASSSPSVLRNSRVGLKSFGLPATAVEGSIRCRADRSRSGRPSAIGVPSP